MKKLLILIILLSLTGCANQNVGVEDVVSEKQIYIKEYITAPENNTYKIGVKNFESKFKDNISDDNSLQYKLNDKYFALTPISIGDDKTKDTVKSVTKNISIVNTLGAAIEPIKKNEWKNVFNNDTEIKVLESDRKWQKL